MPDVMRKTVSASQAAMLFSASPYGTPRTLFDFLHDGLDIDDKENDSMEFGKFAQPFILKRTAEQLNLEVIPNEKDVYERHAKEPLGCTIDAHLTCPSRGPGIVEAKSVRWQVHKEDWVAKKAPLHIELQLQEQMLVRGASWGVIACMVGANEDFILYERRPDERVYKRLITEARLMMSKVANHDRPPAFGHKMELKGLEALFPEIVPTKKFTEPENTKLGKMLLDFAEAQKTVSMFEKIKKELQPQILDITKDCGDVRAFGAMARMTRTPVEQQTLQLPYKIKSGLQKVEEFLLSHESAGDRALADAVRAAISWEHVARRAYNINKIEVTEIDDGEPPARSSWDV